MDFLEYRDEPHIPKGTWADALFKKIVENDAKIIFSDIVFIELNSVGYSTFELEGLLQKLRPIVIVVEATNKQIGKATDLAQKRNIPKGDALHALIARDYRAILVTLDKDFQKLTDIMKPKRPQDLI